VIYKGFNFWNYRQM